MTDNTDSDLRSAQETEYLIAIPGMRDSIREGIETPVDECYESLDW